MASRRSFLIGMPAAAAALSRGASTSELPAQEAPGAAPLKLTMEYDWQFRLDPSSAISPAAVPAQGPEWKSTTVPHTWQSLGGTPDYVGVAWYRTEITALEAWRNAFARIEFEAVFHTAHVFLNGNAVGEHIGKGYTAFCCDLSPQLKYGAVSVLMVRVDNSYGNAMLPRMQSYDWANDGGITRPVRLLISPKVFLDRLVIDSSPDLGKNSATVDIRAVVRNTTNRSRRIQLTGRIRAEGNSGPDYALEAMNAQVPATSSTMIEFARVQIASPALWHFDAPHLYSAEVELLSGVGGEKHMIADTFGIRSFEARGTSFYLNGEPVTLMGVERMAGSHPQFGMAETTGWIEANHRDLKELNCVFTRVHWPQDKRVLDFCDRYGILVQEEIPAWGPFTFDKISDELQNQLEENGLEQLREMVARDRNHPCIVSWGLCNEVNGKNPRTRAFAHRIAEEARKLDPARLLTYASNSLSEDPGADMAGDFDFISANEYYGSWAPGGPKDVHAYIAGIRRAFPNKPIVISEYGWCECQPSIPPGDQNRVNIINSHTEAFREFPEVAGAIYFDYNDYRTLVGDKGTGALKQRVHGVVDLYAGRKPSFEALRLQAGSVEKLSLTLTNAGFELNIVARANLPTYTLRDYSVRWLAYGYDDLPMAGQLDQLAPLKPGDSAKLTARFSTKEIRHVAVDLLRPTGFSVATARLSLKAS